MLVLLCGRLLFTLEATLAGKQFVEVDGVRIEVGALDTGEPGDTVDADATRTAHTGAINHDRVQRHHRGHTGGTSGLGARAHHHHRPDGHYQIGAPGGVGAVDHLGQRIGDQTLAAGTAVVGAHDHLVGPLGKVVLPEREVDRAEADDRRRAVPGLLECPQLRVDRCDAEAAADEHDVADMVDVGGHAEWTDDVGELVTLVILVAHLGGRAAQCLHHERDRAGCGVVVGDRQRNSLGTLVESHHDELSRFGRPSNVAGLHVPQECGGGQFLATDNAIHLNRRVGAHHWCSERTLVTTPLPRGGRS
ncbi:unannotated protein [freshwater metagenome]|uniref:Unannotated protein n=1 Tax=freshwater metagenome TaxID=449393 RepID=A0A6J7AWY6_9ZZZZ